MALKDYSFIERVNLFAIPFILFFTLVNVALSIQKSRAEKAMAGPGRCHPTDACWDVNRIPNPAYQGRVWQIGADSEKVFYANFSKDIRYKGDNVNPLDSAIFISKVVLNEIFDNRETADGITCKFAYDEAKRRIFLIVEPGYCQYYNIAMLPSSPPDSRLYAARNYCPPQCKAPQ